jgi:hypothetical protein
LKRLKNLHFPFWTVLIALPGLCLVAFGLFLTRMGFYWDDWETILVARQFGLSGFWGYFDGTRPLAAWTYLFFTPLVGLTPLAWQILSLTLRCLTALGMGLFLDALWPHHRRSVVFAVLLFAVYPLFVQQSIAVSYHQHWLGFGLYFFSMWTMILAVRHPRRYGLLMPAALVMAGLHLAISEYFLGLELLRPLALWFWFSTSDDRPSVRVRKTARHWLPYLLSFGAFFAWRMAYTFTHTVDTNRPTLLLSLFAQPAAAVLKLAQTALLDTVTILVNVWAKTHDATQLTASTPFTLASWAAALIIAVAAAVYLTRLDTDEDPINTASGGRWGVQLFGFGAAALIFGFAPAWATERHINLSALYTDRYGLAAMFGASLILVALLEFFVHRPRQAILVGVLLGLAVGYHLRVDNNFRWSWTRQLRVHWQLAWRVPGIQAHTAIVSDGDPFAYNHPTFSFNLLYPIVHDPADMPYWFYTLPRSEAEIDAWVAGKKFDETYRNFHFQASSTDSLLITVNDISNCVWVLSPLDQEDPQISDGLRRALGLSNLSRILPEPVDGQTPPTDIFGPEPAHDFCYYYQKTELARQNADWKGIVAIGEEAIEKGYLPTGSLSNFPHEWLPFIEGYARAGEIETAAQWSHQILPLQEGYLAPVCTLWQRVEADPDADANAAAQVRADLNCP